MLYKNFSLFNYWKLKRFCLYLAWFDLGVKTEYWSRKYRAFLSILELEFRYVRKLSSSKRENVAGKVHRVERAASLLKNKAQRNVIREKHFENYNRSMIVTYHRWKFRDADGSLGSYKFNISKISREHRVQTLCLRIQLLLPFHVCQKLSVKDKS